MYFLILIVVVSLTVMDDAFVYFLLCWPHQVKNHFSAAEELPQLLVSIFTGLSSIFCLCIGRIISFTQYLRAIVETVFIISRQKLFHAKMHNLPFNIPLGLHLTNKLRTLFNSPLITNGWLIKATPSCPCSQLFIRPSFHQIQVVLWVQSQVERWRPIQSLINLIFCVLKFFPEYQKHY